MEHSVIFFLFFIFCGTFCASQEKKPCNKAYKCSSLPDPVWTTTDRTSCEVFRNGCYLKNENCQRVNRNELEAVIIPKDDCQLLCGSECPNADGPICGYLNDEKRTFASECEMKNYVCQTGETFDLFSGEACPKTSAK